MLDLLTSPLFLLFARLCVAGVFVASALGKMADREGTATSVARYPFLPKGSGAFIAYTFPYLEMAVAVMLILGIFTRAAALAAILMFLLFTVLVVYDLTRGQEQSCHCFGRISSEKLTPVAVVRNIVLMLLSLVVVTSFSGWLSVDNALNNILGGKFALLASRGASAGIGESLVVILLALFAVGVIVLGEQAVSTVRSTLRGMGYRS